MQNEINIQSWIEKFKAGDFLSYDIKTQISAGWYDWFCRDASLRNKTYRLGAKLLKIAESKKINQETMYVWFKNNCPVAGSLYDDIRIADIETGEVIYTIVPSSGFMAKRGKAEVFGRENIFKFPLVSGSWKEVLDFFNKE